MNRLTRDGTAEPVETKFSGANRGQGNIDFPCSADHEQDWQPYPVDPYSAIRDDHTYTLPSPCYSTVAWARPGRYGRWLGWERMYITIDTTGIVPAGGLKNTLFFLFFVCISLMADGPQHARLPIPPTATLPLPSCLWSRRIFPSLPGSRLENFYRDASSALLQLVNQWLNFTYSRSHAFRYGRQNKNPALTRIELTTSALVGVRGYLLDHSAIELGSDQYHVQAQVQYACQVALLVL